MRPLNVQTRQIHGFPAFFGCRHDLVTHWAVTAETYMHPRAISTLRKLKNQLVECDFALVSHFDDFFRKRQRG